MYNPCHCNPYCCHPCCNCHNQGCSKEEMYNFLGKLVYQQLQTVILPSGHPSLDESICALSKEKPLPPGHPTVQQIMCLAFSCNPKN